MIKLSNILVATGFSEPSSAALRYGCELARHFESTLHVVHVVGTMQSAFSGAAVPIVAISDLQQQAEDAARQELADLLAADEAPPRVEQVVITSNAPAGAIVDYAKERGIGLIVAGTHGRGAVAHALIGSVAERVVRTAPCPVLTVRHPEREFVVPVAGLSTH